MFWMDSPERMKQTAAGFRKKRISLLRDIVMHIAPITIKNRLKSANIAAATFRSAQRKRMALLIWTLQVCLATSVSRPNHSTVGLQIFTGRTNLVELRGRYTSIRSVKRLWEIFRGGLCVQLLRFGDHSYNAITYFLQLIHPNQNRFIFGGMQTDMDKTVSTHIWTGVLYN